MFALLFDKKDDETFGKVLSNNECPSEEPLLMIVVRSFSLIGRDKIDGCWETIAGSIIFADEGDVSRGMFEFDRPELVLEYNDDGITGAVDDGVFI